MNRKSLRFWFFITLYTLVVTGSAYFFYSGEVPTPLQAPLAKIDERVHPPEVAYRLETIPCTEGRRGECQQLVMTVTDRTGTTTTIIDDTLTLRYEAAGGRGRSLELLSVAPAADQFYFEEVFSSSQPRQLFRLEGPQGAFTALPWKHSPFAGDRVSPSGRYVARAMADFSAVELFDIFTTTSSTPLRLSSEAETLAATACGFAGKSPNLTWLTENVLTVEIFAREPEGVRACAGPLLRTVTVVVE